MINIKFLRTQKPVHGLEFMDFQNKDFYNQMVDLLSPVIANNTLHEIPEQLNECIAKYTGFKNITFHLVEWGNVGIDTGFMSPFNIFNNKDIDIVLPKSQTTLFRWFKENKKNLLKGTIDFSTGKVGGDYSTLPMNIYINKHVSEYMRGVKPEELSGALATTFAHELGHGFSAVMGIHQSMVNNIAIRAMLHFMSDSKYGQATVGVVKDTLGILEVDKSLYRDIEKMITDDDKEAALIYVSKLKANQDQMNTRSLGVKEMNSEVIADLYAVRMGCDKHMVNHLKGLHLSLAKKITFLWFPWLAMTSILTIIGVPVLAAATGASVGVIYLALASTLLSSEYNTDYRRLLNIFQEQIQRVKSDKFLSPKEKAEYVRMVNEAVQVLKEVKPFFEDTGMQRLIGWLNEGDNFKQQQLEHYTQIVANNQMTLLNEQIQQLS